MTLPSVFTDRVTLSCEARVGEEACVVRIEIAQAVYDHPDAREAIERQLRQSLMLKILEKWTPVVRVHR